MNDFDVMNLLGRAFADGEADALKDHLSSDCKYTSDSSGVSLTGADEIINRMKEVWQCNHENDRYSYKCVPIAELLKTDNIETADVKQGMRLNNYALLLYQYSEKYPDSVASSFMEDESGKITSIRLSRDSKLYKVHFFEEAYDDDSPFDRPSTVKPFTTHDRHVKEMSRYFSGQHLNDIPQEIKGNLYIWKEADQYFKLWLQYNGYDVLMSVIFDDCIGYKCLRSNCLYAIYMYAYGKKKTAKLDGDNCKKLLDYDFSSDSIVLVTVINVRRFRTGNEITYKIGNRNGELNAGAKLWQISYVNGRYIPVFYPREEVMNALDKFVYAFNNNDLDVYDTIISQTDPTFYDEAGNGGTSHNEGIYMTLRRIHNRYGDMRIGYVSFDGVIFSRMAYIKNYGWFGISLVNNSDRIVNIRSYSFDNLEREAAEFILTNESDDKLMYANIPGLKEVHVFPPIPTERFALKLLFENGERRKYILPISINDEKKDVIEYREHVFTDRIWKSAFIKDMLRGELMGYRDRRASVVFKNDFFISALLCYLESTPYSEAEKCDDVVYDDGKNRIKRIWKWRVINIYKNGETGLLDVRITGDGFHGGKCTFASVDGERISSIDFDYIDSFKDGLALVAKAGFGYGFVDKHMHFVIPMKFDYAEEFKDGKAKVRLNDEWFFIDKTGKETHITSIEPGTKYQEIGKFSQGLCKVSTLDLKILDLAYHSDYSEIAGCWGFIDETGKEVIAPQYIYAQDFSNGLAIVCKGKWTLDPKWDNEYAQGKYWTEEELWGAIDKNGDTKIPFVFDEIRYFYDADDIFMAHYGGWDNGKWGVIDSEGNWLADPIFEAIDYEYNDGLFAFYQEDRWDDNAKLGIYDINRQKVIFEPQFYDVAFYEDGWIGVEVFDETLDRCVEKLIDINGNEKFLSEYTRLYPISDGMYKASIWSKDGDRQFILDSDGKVIKPRTSGNIIEINQKNKRMTFSENDKVGVMDLSGNIIIPPVYYQIENIDKRFFIVKSGDKERHTSGLVSDSGTVILPCIYEDIRWYDDNHLLCNTQEGWEMLLLTEK